MKKILIISLAINLIFLVVIGYLLFDAGVLKGILKSETRLGELEKRIINLENITGQIVNFLNANIKK